MCNEIFDAQIIHFAYVLCIFPIIKLLTVKNLTKSLFSKDDSLQEARKR